MISFALFVILPCLKVANSDDPFPILVSLSSRTTAAIQDENTTMSCTFLVPKKCNETCQDARLLFQDPITRQLRDASLLYHHYTSLRTLKVGDDKIQIDTDLRILPVTTAVREKYFCTVKCLNSTIVSSGELKTVFLPRRSFPGISKTPGAQIILVSKQLPFSLSCTSTWIVERLLYITSVTWTKNGEPFAYTSAEWGSKQPYVSTLRDLALPKDSGIFTCTFVFRLLGTSASVCVNDTFDVREAMPLHTPTVAVIATTTDSTITRTYATPSMSQLFTPNSPSPTIVVGSSSSVMPHNLEPLPSPRVITSISAYVEHHPCFPILRCDSVYEGNAQLEIIMIVWDRNGATHASIVQRPNGGNQSSFTLLDRGDGLYGCTIEYTLGRNSNGNETFFANGTFLYFDSARDNACVNSRSKRSPPDLFFPSPIHAHTETMATLLAHNNATKRAISTSFYFLLLLLILRLR